MCWGFHWKTLLSWGDSLSHGSVSVTVNCWNVLRLSPKTNLALVQCFWLRLNISLKYHWEVRSATRKYYFLSDFSRFPFVPNTAWWGFLSLNVTAAVKDCILFENQPLIRLSLKFWILSTILSLWGIGILWKFHH